MQASRCANTNLIQSKNINRFFYQQAKKIDESALYQWAKQANQSGKIEKKKRKETE